MKFDDSSPFALLPSRGREAHGRGRGRKGASRPLGGGAAAGDVRCRLLPAERAADGRA
jgi:hypothetical protein